MYWIIFYLIGCLLSYFKAVGCLATEIKAPTVLKFLLAHKCTALFIVLGSWIGFTVGATTYYAYQDKKFFKWSPKDHS